MNIVDYTINCKSRSDVFKLIPIGDIHYGTKNCDVKKLDGLISWIATQPNVYWIGMGDMVEAINYSDKRFDPRNILPELQNSLDNLPSAQAFKLAKKFNCIKHKCIGLLEGNHEETVRLRYHLSITDLLADKLETKNLGYNCFIRLYFNRTGNIKTVMIYATHGFGGGRKPGGQVNNITDIARDFESDIYLFGHVHNKIGIDRERLEVNHKGKAILYARKKVFAITGSFYNAYVVGCKSYAEKMGYSPNPTGIVKITIEPHRSRRSRGEEPAHIHLSE
jgi:hypothetical protein